MEGQRFVIVTMFVALACDLVTSVIGAQVSPPPEWQSRIAASKMLFSNVTEFSQGLQLWPNIGNGYVGGVLGCFKTDIGTRGVAKGPGSVALGNLDPVATAGVVHVGGVFSGNGTFSDRAEVPGVHSVYPVAASAAVDFAETDSVSFAGAAIDFEKATFYNRTILHGCNDAVLEQRWYAHQVNRSVLVYEMELLGAHLSDADTTCTIHLNSCNVDDTSSMVTESVDVGGILLSNSTIVQPETLLSPVSLVSRAFRPVSSEVNLSSSTVDQYIAVLRTNLVQEGESEAKSPWKIAAKDYNDLVASMNSSVIARTHQDAWLQLWSTRIELQGNTGDDVARAVASAVNSSMYYLLSAARNDWPFATSPGGIANRAYQGHTFWDLETWQFPALLPFYPELGKSLLAYRERVLPAAKDRARQFGWAGALFPWESAVSGQNVCPWALGADFEQHITGDVAMAVRQQYYFTRDTDWLKNHGWPLLQAAAEFWASRVVLDTASGNYTVKGVVAPDESAGKVDDEAYTNAVAASTLSFAIEAAAVVGAEAGSNWSTIASKPFLPLRDDLLSGFMIHSQDATYQKGQMITQSDVGLLQYPLEVSGIDDSVKRGDLLYYESVTNPDGYYTGDSSYSIAWLALGNRTAADAQFARTFLYLNGLPNNVVVAPHYNPFNVWKEAATSGKHLNFLTGAGGFLQNIIQGYAGLRARSNILQLNPSLPPHAQRLSLVRLSYAGAQFSVDFNSTTVQVTLEEAPAEGKTILLLQSGGVKTNLTERTVATFNRSIFELSVVD